LETLDISDLIREVRIWVNKPDVDAEIPCHEISDGEKQLQSVLGLMRFIGRDESLFQLDEPDTPLNTLRQCAYLQLVKEVAQRNGESHIYL
jgi:predicted ATPase